MTARVKITRDTATPALRRLLGVLTGEGRDLMLRAIWVSNSVARKAAGKVVDVDASGVWVRID